MIKETITYVDYNGVEKTEDKYFNLSKAELLKMQYSTEGGMIERLKNVVDNMNGKDMLEIFDELLVNSYGVVSENGGFVKNDKLREEFKSSEAYSELFVKLMSDVDEATRFINGVIPESLRAAVAEQIAEGTVVTPIK